MGDPNDKLVADTLSLSDGIRGIAYLPFAVLISSDAIGLSDIFGLPSFKQSGRIFFVDQVRVALNTAIPGRISRSVGDLFNLSDKDIELAAYSKALIDSIVLSDSMNNGMGVVKPLADTFSVTDGVTLLLAVLSSLSDTLSLTDTATRTLSGSGSLTETISDALDLFDSIQFALVKNSQILLGDYFFLDDHVDVILHSFGTSYLRRYLNDVLPN